MEEEEVGEGERKEETKERREKNVNLVNETRLTLERSNPIENRFDTDREIIRTKSVLWLTRGRTLFSFGTRGGRKGGREKERDLLKRAEEVGQSRKFSVASSLKDNRDTHMPSN